MGINEKEWEEFLLNNQPNEEFRKHYIERLNENLSEYYQTLNEAETAYLFDRKFKIPVVNFDEKTIYEKDVDLLVNFDNEKIYIEITGFKYQKDKKSDNQQDAKLARALNHGSEKFFEKATNLLIVYDEQMYSLFYDPDYDPKFIYDNVVSSWFQFGISIEDYEETNLKKISGLLLFGKRHLEDNRRDFILYENSNSFKSNKNLFNILSKSKDPLCINLNDVDDLK